VTSTSTGGIHHLRGHRYMYQRCFALEGPRARIRKIAWP
jgi:hypothetical protein